MRLFPLLPLLAACALAGGGKRPVAPGTWGGPHAVLTVIESGARIEFDCAHGTVDEPLLADDEGNFEAGGTFSPEHGGPVRRGEEDARRPARYSGMLEGDRLTLKVEIPAESRTVGTFTLRQGKVGLLHKCL